MTDTLTCVNFCDSIYTVVKGFSAAYCFDKWEKLMIGILKNLIKKAVKLFGFAMGVVLIALVGYLVYAINPWNVPAIFKRNYPEWFAAHPFISSLIKVD